MAQDQGWTGLVTIDGDTIAEITSWDIQFDGGEVVNTVFSDDFVQRTYTIADSSGNFAGFGDQTDATGQELLIAMFVDGGTLAPVWLYLYISGAVGYYGTALVSPGKNVQAGQAIQRFSSSFRQAAKWYKNF